MCRSGRRSAKQERRQKNLLATSGMQLLHRLVELAVHGQRQRIKRAGDAVEDRVLVLRRRPAQHPRGDLVLVAGMADAETQAVELAVTQVGHDVAQAVLAAVAAVELHSRGASREVQVVMRDQALLRRNLVVAQRGSDRDAALVHEGGGLEQPHRLAADAQLAALAVQLAVEAPALVLTRRQGVHKPEPGVVPGSEVFGTGIAQSDDEPETCHGGQQAHAARAPTGTRAAAAYFLASLAGVAAAAGAASAAASSAAGASSTSSFTTFAVTTATSWLAPRCSATISTPFGSFSCDRWTMSPTLRSARSSSMCSGRSFGRQETSTSVRLCEITTPEVLAASDFSWLRKCSGTFTRTAAFSSMRRKSMCIICCLNGCFCQSRTSTFCTLPSTFRSSTEEKNHSCLAASRMVLCSIWMLCAGWPAP